ncbi:MAG TPA: hypothetical protein VGD94_15960 [Vicinamibacterales bacterium]
MKVKEAVRTPKRRGGRDRVAKRSAAERQAIASRGGKARSLSRHATRRIIENFRYLAAADALRRSERRVSRMRRLDGPLPGSGLAGQSHEGSRRTR